jgi:Putative NADPH-quinone reductase (modulator of drug activity B)
MTRILLIDGHPDPAPRRLCHALADAYLEGARAAGHTVTRIDLAGLDVPLLRSQEAFTGGAVPPELTGAAEALCAAEHVVVVFPLWLGTMPALLKAFFEQVMRPGVAFEYQANGLPKTLLKGRSARVVVTMGMPALVYRWWFRAHGVANLRRNILGFVGIGPVRETLLGGAETAETATRERWLVRLRALGAAAR